MIRIIVIDNEKSIIEELALLLKSNSDYTLVGSCGSIKEAQMLIPSKQPDVLLLDIELSDGTGFDLLQSLDNINFHVIFITGFDKYAIQAIKSKALDYLLKPIDDDELLAALDKVKDAKLLEQSISKSLANAKQQHQSQNAYTWNRIVLRSQYALQVVSFDDILYCESSASYTHFHLTTDKRKVVTSKPIKEYEQLLPPQRFLRCHHSYIVNGTFIDEFRTDSSCLVLKDGQQIPVSRRKKEQVISFLTGNRPESI